MKIAAIDPGTKALGYCVMEQQDRRRRIVVMGTLRPRARHIHERLLEIGSFLDQLFKRHRPDHIALERAHVGRNAASALRLAEARGVTLACAARSHARLFEYAPSEAKQALTANGAAAKSSVQRVLQLLLNLSSPPDPDSADAAALALCHSNRWRPR